METKYQKDALFSGMTSNAFKLGLVLTYGWFWVRSGGCSVLYRGESIEKVDFENILTVAGAHAEEISPPDYVQHGASSAYYYVSRNVNVCGCEEQTLCTAIKLSIDSCGELASDRPNSVFAVRAVQSAGSKVCLQWYYCPLGQESEPVCFKIYCDNGTGDIDYESSIATVSYAGRKLYSYENGIPGTGKYQFCIKAEDAQGVQSSSLAAVTIDIDSVVCDSPEILSVETI